MAVTYSDREVRQNVWDEISHDVRLDSSDITVSITDGIVRLAGTAPTYAEKMTAARDAGRIKGVLDVANDLTVRPTQVWADHDVRDAVRRSLDRDARIADPLALQVEVTFGVVTLTGSVPSYGQRTAAEDDAWTAPGVVDVLDRIAVEPPLRPPDAALAADVRRALDTDPDINAARIAASVLNGVVYLRGAVPTYYQRGEAAEEAWGVPGVAGVVDELSVAG